MQNNIIININPTTQSLTASLDQPIKENIIIDTTKNKVPPISGNLTEPLLQRYSVSAEHTKASINNQDNTAEVWVLLSGGASDM